MSLKVSLILTCILVVLGGCRSSNPETGLFELFEDPPAESRPFVRWWWNGNVPEQAELKREIDLLKKAGFGGVEINPIAMPEEATDIGTNPMRWMSEEWRATVEDASDYLEQQDMVADMIVGSGWPFGGKFLEPGERIQKLVPEFRTLDGSGLQEISAEKILEDFDLRNQTSDKSEYYSRTLEYVKLIPSKLQSISEITDITDKVRSGSYRFDPGNGEYILVWGIMETGYREVMFGAEGADGPTMDHYRAGVTLTYLERLKKLAQDTGVPLNQLIRALFCDSIELAGSNWSKGFGRIFLQRYGYDIEPWLPLVLSSEEDSPQVAYRTEALKDSVLRARYDFSEFMVEMYLENFVGVMQEFCWENGLQFRYQAYGHPWLMGISEGNMLVDIPESNNWLYSASPFSREYYTWNADHGFMAWNEYASSGGHLTGRKIISCESMTNTRGVFQTTLATIKQADDMNFISGINHSVLHGFNYSPPEAGFPGWIRFGTYFSEYNTWWPYLQHWVTYNARISAVLQHSKPEVDIAILGPQADVWSTHGLERWPFHMTPWYVHQLWQPISQSGNASDMISDTVLTGGKIVDGRLNFGPMSYNCLLACDVHTIALPVLKAMLRFAASGGTVVLIGDVPRRNPSMAGTDATPRVAALTDSLLSLPNVFRIKAPEKTDSLSGWYREELISTGIIEPVVEIGPPDPGLYQLHHSTDQQNIWFFTNTHRETTIEFRAKFRHEKASPWLWNPETGHRMPYLHGRNENDLDIRLAPLESVLIVFEKGDRTAGTFAPLPTASTREVVTPENWKKVFHHVNGQVFERNGESTGELTASGDSALMHFAGSITYSTTVDLDQAGEFILLAENVHHGITELKVNGRMVGTTWYGEHGYDISDFVKPGKNQVELVYTGVLNNHCLALEDNPAAERWSRDHTLLKQGIEGPVVVLKKQ